MIVKPKAPLQVGHHKTHVTVGTLCKLSRLPQLVSEEGLRMWTTVRSMTYAAPLGQWPTQGGPFPGVAERIVAKRARAPFSLNLPKGVRLKDAQNFP